MFSVWRQKFLHVAIAIREKLCPGTIMVTSYLNIQWLNPTPDDSSEVTLIPDLVTVTTDGSRAMILDVTCTYEVNADVHKELDQLKWIKWFIYKKLLPSKSEDLSGVKPMKVHHSFTKSQSA